MNRESQESLRRDRDPTVVRGLMELKPEKVARIG